jgi:AbrB family looped-hinge helix DNA binding protein
METTLTSKGQATIPKHIRDSFGLKAGSRVVFAVNKQGELVLRPANPAQPTRQETMQDRLERALAALGPIDNKWEGDTDSYMAFLRGEA